MLDLHCHSTASDGTVAPELLPALAEKNGVTALALTDHDTLEGVVAFQNASAHVSGVLCIPGIELACEYSKDDHPHIVGLFVDPESRELQTLCSQIIRWRDERNEEMLRRINELGYPLTMAEVQRQKQDPLATTGRPHFAAALRAKGYFEGQADNAPFETLIGMGRPAYVRRQVPGYRECFDAIHAAGGLAIWAHPMVRRSMTNVRFAEMLDCMMEDGLDGVEAYYPDHSQANIRTVLECARVRRLLVSGGSDFHGAHHPDIELGRGRGDLNVPDELLEKLINAVAAR